MKYIIANFKLNGDSQQINQYINQIKKHLKKPTNMLVALPFTYLHYASKFAKNGILVGAQNLSNHSNGAFTGEVSAHMVKDAGANFVILGHSERRHIFGETCEQIAKKITLATKENLKVVLCVGEKLEDKNKYKSVIATQLKSALSGADLSNIIIAYEPVWAIGTGEVATLKDIQKVHGFIKQYITNNFGKQLPVVYGGSVNPKNSAQILALSCVDGVLVGGACLNPESFAQIYKSQF